MSSSSQVRADSTLHPKRLVKCNTWYVYMQCLCLFNDEKQSRIYAVFIRRRHVDNRKHTSLTFTIVFTMKIFLREAITAWADLFFTKQ